MLKKIVVLEISGATEEDIQRDLGQAFHEFCEKNQGSGIVANIMTEDAGREVMSVVYGEERGVGKLRE